MVEASSGVNPQSAASATGAEESGAASGAAKKESNPYEGKTIPNSFDGTLGGLKAIDEELYNRMMESFAMNVCKELKKDQEEAKKKRKEYERWIRG